MCLVSSVASPGVSSRVGSCIGILSKFSIGNNLLLKLLGTFSIILNNNPKLFKKNYFSIIFSALSELFILAVKLLWSSTASSNYKCPSYISLKKQQDKNSV